MFAFNSFEYSIKAVLKSLKHYTQRDEKKDTRATKTSLTTLTSECIATGRKIATDTQAGVPMTQTSTYPICKRFSGLLPEPLYHSLLNTAVRKKTFFL
jgi:hypothetical protein